MVTASWRDGVVYQIYPRSFQDSNGDGVGDLRGVTSRLDHLERLDVDALWLSPFYPSPGADFGYDVSCYTDVDPLLGSLDDFDELVAGAHERGLRVLLDLVPCHTSIEHPWFRKHPGRYIWADASGRPPNNWTSAFGGSAWSLDEKSGRLYMHSFYPEQPDLDWHDPEVPRAIGDVLRFWLDRGADGFRLDAIDRLVKDPALRDDPPSEEPFGLPLLPHELGRDLCNSRNAAGTDRALAALREAAGDAFLVGEVYLPTSKYRPFLDQLDRAFVFELLMSAWESDALGHVIEVAAALEGRRGAGAAWVLSNHDFGRLSSRYGPENERAAAVMLLTLPGTAFIYQGDEIGMVNGPGGTPPRDRVGRDSFRHPMQWDGSPGGGFTRGTPWLPLVDPDERNVADQSGRGGSLLELFRALIAIRRGLGHGFRMLESTPGVLAYERGEHVVAINLAGEERPAPGGEIALATHGLDGARSGTLAAHGAVICRP